MASLIVRLFTLFSLFFLANAYTNPIRSGGFADPWVLAANGGYYLLFTTGADNVQVYFSQDLTNFDNASGGVVWSGNGNQHGIWAPELHYIDGRYYIYVAISDGDNANHRMYVLEGDTQDPLLPFTLVGQLTTPDNNWAIDGTVLRDYNGKNYFIWSGWTDPGNQQQQQLYIAEMASPTQLTGNRVLLHSPDPSWQQRDGFGINEGPEILVHDGRTFLVYSASASWTDSYCLGMMGIDGGADVMNPANWWKLDDRPVFWSSDVAFGPGHASFPFDSAGTPWIVYHATETVDGGWAGRTIRTEKFGWNADSSPAFPSPKALHVDIEPGPA